MKPTLCVELEQVAAFITGLHEATTTTVFLLFSFCCCFTLTVWSKCAEEGNVFCFVFFFNQTAFLDNLFPEHRLPRDKALLKLCGAKPGSALTPQTCGPVRDQPQLVRDANWSANVCPRGNGKNVRLQLRQDWQRAQLAVVHRTFGATPLQQVPSAD